MLDPDWDQNDTGHPAHFLDGDELGKGPWVVGGAYFSVITTEHRFYAGITAWYQRRKAEDGLYEMEQAAVERHLQERKQWNKNNVDLPA